MAPSCCSSGTKIFRWSIFLSNESPKSTSQTEPTVVFHHTVAADDHDGAIPTTQADNKNTEQCDKKSILKSTLLQMQPWHTSERSSPPKRTDSTHLIHVRPATQNGIAQQLKKKEEEEHQNVNLENDIVASEKSAQLTDRNRTDMGTHSMKSSGDAVATAPSSALSSLPHHQVFVSKQHEVSSDLESKKAPLNHTLSLSSERKSTSTVNSSAEEYRNIQYPNVPLEKLSISRYGQIIVHEHPVDAQAQSSRQNSEKIHRNNAASASTEPLRRRDMRREQKWLDMFNTWPRHRKLKERIRKGIPDCLRGEAWRRLCDCKVVDREQYQALLLRHTDVEDIILRDIHRTFPNNIFFVDKLCNLSFKGAHSRQSLYNVLKAYAAHDRRVSYCQGMGFLAALLLMYMSEEESFAMLSKLLHSDKFMLAGLYLPTFPLLREWFYILQQLQKRYVPRVHRHFIEHDIQPTMYATQWFITLYSYSWPFEIVLRIWDILFNEGTKIMFRVAIHIFHELEHELVNLDMEHVIMCLRDVHTHTIMSDADRFISRTLRIPLRTSELQRHSQEYYESQAHAEQKTKNN